MTEELLPGSTGEGSNQGESVPSRRDVINDIVTQNRAAFEEQQTQAARVRDERGRFAPGQAQAQITPPPVARKAMPRSWKQDYAPHWGQLSDDLANFIADLEESRERQVMEGVNKYKGLAQQFDGLNQILGPRAQALAATYGSVPQGVATLFQISDFAERDPIGFLRSFMQARGIQPNQLLAPQAQPDPYIQAMQAAVQPVAQQVQGVTQYLRQQAYAQQQAAQAASLKVVESFLGEKDAQGNAVHPLDESLYEEFAKRVRFIRSQNPVLDDKAVLDQAYVDFAWTNESLRAKQLEREAAAMRERQQKQLAARRQAATMVKGAPGTSPASTIDPKDRRAVIEQAMSRLTR